MSNRIFSEIVEENHMENKNNNENNINTELFPDIEFLDDIEFENDITRLESIKEDVEDTKSKRSDRNKKKRNNSVKKRNIGKSDDKTDDKGNTAKDNRKKSQKKKSKFKLGLLIYAAVLLVIIVGVWIFFYSFIDGYEKGMSYNEIAEIARELGENPDSILSNIQVSNEFEDSSYAITYIKNLIQGKEIEYREAKENTTTNPVYELLVEDKVFAKVTLKQDGEIKHGFKNWVLSEVSTEEYLPATASVVVYSPSNSEVYINGKEVGESYIIEENLEIEVLDKVAQYLDSVPTQTKYEVKGFFETPQIEVKDENGNVLDLLAEGNTYTAGFAYDTATADEFKTYVEDVTYAYARNFANLAKNIFNYVRPGSDLYASIESATTYFYPDSKISGTEFTSREITDFVRYTDDCFTCHVKYDYTVYFTGYSIDKDVSSVDMIWVFVENDGLWYLTDTKYY